mmetsp:Transcript_33230/g.79590  ORF Transcript_33230/g.79590 Transcript_33230/m.79590 type:complete len:200 (-) Transcript_33230:515-1114(-)
MECHNSRNKHVSKVEVGVEESRQEPQESAEANDVREEADTGVALADHCVLQRGGVEQEQLLQLFNPGGAGMARGLRELLLHLLVLAANGGLGQQALDSQHEPGQRHEASDHAHGSGPKPESRNRLTGMVCVDILRVAHYAQDRQEDDECLQQVAGNVQVQVRGHEKASQEHGEGREAGRYCCIVVHQHHELLHLQGSCH